LTLLLFKILCFGWIRNTFNTFRFGKPQHISASPTNCQLTTPALSAFKKRKKGNYDIVIVAYDYFAEFAIFCGVLGSFGIEIQEAFISTYGEPLPSTFPERRKTPRSGESAWQRPRPPRTPGLARKKIVDVFRVQLLEGFHLGPHKQRQLSENLLAMARLLDKGELQEARRQVNRGLIETLGRIKLEPAGLSPLVDMLFENNTVWDYTIISIRSKASTAFLYSFVNALTMRGISIARATVAVMEEGFVRNRFYVRGRDRKPIIHQTEFQHIRITAALVQKFTHDLSISPDPAKAMEYFYLFLDDLLKEDPDAFELFDAFCLLPHFARVFGTSDFLGEEFLRRLQGNFLPFLENLPKECLICTKSELTKTLRNTLGRAKGDEARRTRLNQFKDEELFRIDVKHLLENAPVSDFSQALTNLAEVILEQALAEAKRVVHRSHKPPSLENGEPCPLTICGLGKLGGGEIGYASDIEILFVYDTGSGSSSGKTTDPTDYFERLAQEVLHWIEAKQEGIFHIDTRLRPYGEKGLLANSLEEICHYYSPNGMAAPFERQILIKLRSVAGDAELGKRVEAHRDAFVYGEEPWPLETALHLRERQSKELVPPGKIHVKYSSGGLIDIEYTAQYLQILHGHQAKALQTPHTLYALSALRDEGYLPPDEAQTLHEDYLFLRLLIDGLRIVRGNAQDLLLPESGSDDMIFLARRLGFLSEDWQESAASLEQEIQHRMARTHRIFHQHFAVTEVKL